MRQVDTSRPVHLIINPRSGYGGSRHMLGQLRTAARRSDVNLVEYTTCAPGDATRYARSIVGKAAATMVWGGDGTVNEVASALAGTDVPLLPCRAGTECLLARELGVPVNPGRIIQVLQSGSIVAFDVGSVNQKHFILIIGIGFDGEVVRRVTAARTGHISHLSYAWPIWRTFWEHKFPRMRIVADGQEVFNAPGMAFVGNISRYATGLRICRDADFADGLLDLVVYSCTNQISLAFHAARTVLRRHPLHAGVLYQRFRDLTIESSEPAPCQVDGDVGPATPLEISVSPDRIQLVVPQHHSPWYSRLWKGGQRT